MNMREVNINDLVQASIYSHNLPYAVIDAIADFFIDTMAGIDDINVDDFIVNGICVIDSDEYDEEKHSILYQDENTVYVI